MKCFISAWALPIILNCVILNCSALGAEKSVIVGFKQRPGLRQPLPVQLGNGRIERRFQLIPAVVATLPEEEIANLRRNRDIAYVEENAIYTAASSSAEEELSWQVPHTFSGVAHASGNFGTGVQVAVLDTGIDYTHEELDGNYRGGYDFVFRDSDPFDDSYNSHGTHVAGIIAAERNGVGVVGVAPEAGIYAVKVLDGAGFGTTDWIIAGIEWAVSQGVDVINMSLSGPDRQALRDACEQARSAGVLLVAAGGNSLAGGGPVMYPAAYDSVIAVTATDDADLRGFNSPLGSSLELAAPGVGIYSTVAGDNFSTLSGTSQAAACVSGVAALYLRSQILDLNDDRLVNHEDVRLALQLTASDLGDPGRDEIYGFGLVDALAASLDLPVSLTVAKSPRVRGQSIDDSVVTKLSDDVFNISVRGAGLRGVGLSVYEGGNIRTDLSRTVTFPPGMREATFVLQLIATGSNFKVVFTPYGQVGGSANVVIRRAID